MPALIADMFLSVDGYARGSCSPAYFGFAGPDLERWISDEMSRPHWQVMGRRTYSALAALPEEVRDEGWRRMAQTHTVVFSRTLQEVSWPKATINSNDVVDEVLKVKASEDVELRTIGSLSLVRQLLNAGHVDRLRLMVFPLIVGKTGQEPFFAQLTDIALELVTQTVLDGRVVSLTIAPSARHRTPDDTD